MLTFVTPIAYDYSYAFASIQSYYAIADEVILGIDKDRISWSKHSIPFDNNLFFNTIRKMDVEKKIRILEDNFHSHDSPLTNDQFERQTLTRVAKPGNWVIQIDSDEVLLNPEDFRNWIKTVPDNVGIKAQWITIFKKLGSDYLLINEGDGLIAVGTKDPSKLILTREVSQPYMKSPLVLLHYAYGRERSEVEQKLKNWGHSKDINMEKLMAIWDYANLETYQNIRNFHPLYPPWWHSLRHVRMESPV